MSRSDRRPGEGSRGGDVPPGPWLLVVGMHRSGTSGITGVLGALGFANRSDDDRMDSPESNPEHWESLALASFDDQLLDRLGGSWDAPPALPEGWEHRAIAGDQLDPTPELRRAFPDPGPLVWKDPRLCLLLPYWRQVLPAPLAAVMIWRSPSGVAESLHRRDGFDPILSLALWERYNRAGLVNLDGIDTYLMQYERLLAEPHEMVTDLAAWLGSLGQFAGLAAETKVAEAVATLTGTDRPGTPVAAQPEAGLELLAQQRALLDYLAANPGGHRPFGAPALGDDAPWTTAMIGARREFRSRELDGAAQVFESRLTAARAMSDYWERTAGAMTDSTSWRITRPLRSITARLHQRGQAAGRPPEPPLSP